MRAEDRGSFRGSTSLAEALAEALFSICRIPSSCFYGDGRLGNITNFQRDSAVMCLPPFTLNPKMKILLYLRSPNKFWAWRWRCCSWYTSSLELSHVLARRKPSRDRVPRASDVTGISRKLRGSSAEAPRKLRDGFGSIWSLLLYLSSSNSPF